VAEVSVPGLDVSLADKPADDAAAGGDPYLRRVTFKVASVPRESFDFDHALPAAYRSRTTLIARTGN